MQMQQFADVFLL